MTANENCQSLPTMYNIAVIYTHTNIIFFNEKTYNIYPKAQ